MSSTTSRPARVSGAGTGRRSFTPRQIAAAALVAVVIDQNRKRVEVSVLLLDV